MSLPDVDVLRRRIERISDKEMRLCLMACYLWAARIKEVVGKILPGDRSGLPIARGPVGSDARLDHYNGCEIALFNVYTEKREGKKRIIALPINHESWAFPLYEHFEQKPKDERVFPFSRQDVWRYQKENKVFNGLNYPIERYVIWKDGKLDQVVDKHIRAYTLHALRHSRATELVEYYGFDGFNLATYGGWTYQTMTKISSVMERYLTLGWQSYIAKLLKKRTW